MWVVTGPDGAPACVQSGNQLKVPRAVAGQSVVKVLVKPEAPKDGGPTVEVTRLNVWIVWADGHLKQPQPPVDGWTLDDSVGLINGGRAECLFFQTTDPVNPLSGDHPYPFLYTFDIQPKAITDLTQDVPDLTGPSDPDHPPCDKSIMHFIERDKPVWKGAPNRWDTTQAVRVTVDNPNLIDRGKLPIDGIVFDGQPATHLVPIPFPQDDADGNDDYKTNLPPDDPYHPYLNPDGDNPLLVHDTGSLVQVDAPQQCLADFSDSNDQQLYQGATFHIEFDFATFARLQIGNKWYRVSGHQNWYYSLRMKCQDGFWQNDFSKCGN